MLNELYQLSLALKEIGIEPYNWHKDLKPLPKATKKKPCFKILISPNASVSSIETIDQEHASGLRKWEPSLGHSFPGFNIHPLYRVVDKDRKEQIKRFREGKDRIDLSLIRRWCTEDAKNWNEKIDRKLSKCLGMLPSKLQELCVDIPDNFIALRKLCERVLKWESPSISFFDSLEAYVFASLQKEEHVSSILSILLHEGSADKPFDKDHGSVSVFMDVPDWEAGLKV